MNSLESLTELRNETEEGMDDVDAMDSLLSQELLQLSMNDRTAMEEEIHGVRCIAPEETTQLLQNSLKNLAMVLANDEIIPPSEKRAYLLGMSLPRTHINTDGFRLRFLRFHLFDVVKAAKKLVNFLNITAILFGDVVLERPIQLSDFNKRELQLMRSGSIQFLPFRDRSGRRVLVVINPKPFDATENERYMKQNHSDRAQGGVVSTGKIFIYMAWVAGEDVDVQRKGIVVITWFDTAFNVILANKASGFASYEVRTFDLASVRLSALHLCVPDTNAYRFITTMCKIKTGSPFRMRMKCHFGESVERMYMLRSYGIPTEHIPLSFSGTIKTGYMKQWTRAREARESTLYLQRGSNFTGIIECPNLCDVLFRQGISLTWNPGNARIRSMIQEMMSDRKTAEGDKRVKPKRREMVLDIIDDVGKTCRFLTWNDGGWWTEMHDREQLILKIEYLIKDVRKSSKRVSRQQKLNSNTSIFFDNKMVNPNLSGANNDSSEDEGQSCQDCML